MEIELYIANKLCDSGSLDLGIRLKRAFLNPSELNTKDAQKSYSITIPATTANNEIFGYRNVEEVGNKFKIYPNARLYVGGVLILDGKFMLTEITRDGYKGNLGVPKRKEVKDLFGSLKMGELKPWILENFKGLNSISEYNEKDNPECIFPLVLYGLLPKVENMVENPQKDEYDQAVRLTLEDFPPSINCAKMLEHIFNSLGYNLSGSALTDERLNKLYVSYKNPNDHEMDWGSNDIILRGLWKFYDPDMHDQLVNRFKYGEDKQVSVDLLTTRARKLEVISDNGGNISEEGSNYGGTYISIPYSGLYKINLRCEANILDNTIYPESSGVGVLPGDLDKAPMEIHLCRNVSDISTTKFNNKFSYDNIRQEVGTDISIYPRANNVNFIDVKQDKNFLCGFSFGKHSDDNYRNPLNPSSCNPMAISGGQSWDFNNGEGVTDRAYSAVYSPSYLFGDKTESSYFKVDLEDSNTYSTRLNDKSAIGEISQVVWLEKGDRINVIFTTQYRMQGVRLFINDYSILYDLSIKLFQHEQSWLKINDDGSSSAVMKWNDTPSFIDGQIDLVKFFPIEIKINDWVENFCKAFNLELHDIGDGFSLDLRNKRSISNTSIIIDLDKRANVNQSFNQPINAPHSYELGFTIDTDEEGYYDSQIFDENKNPIPNSGNTGGGVFLADDFSSDNISQTSFFSYCWYKKIHLRQENTHMMLPVITDKDIWIGKHDYKEMMSKTYLDKAQRFWYKSGEIEISTGAKYITNALVSNEYEGTKPQILDYEDKPNSLMSNLFLLLKNDKSYTVVECYLTPQEYSKLDVSLARFNGDLYNIAEIDGYDPLGRSKCILKLIRKI